MDGAGTSGVGVLWRMPLTDQDWIRAFARQALSDLRVRDLLQQANVEKCHRLHFLQMAAEKICKSHLIRENGRGNVQNVHTYTAKILPIIARQFYSRPGRKAAIPHWELSAIRHLAYEIEKLAPACDAGDLRPDNSEYPWEDSRGQVCVPCEYNFPSVDDGIGGKSAKAMVDLIRLMREAAEHYAK